ncbi:DUF6026 family protein [Pseudomonas huanghezhanensis]|uniref:DUF6026 family protein n=1 Tax=Pseudomonas huanghezhanensis TaxID=3002903 RepID=UPI002285E8F3|nr:DUF6026 family protein [Pseudomonas sp. BSw22131]
MGTVLPVLTPQTLYVTVRRDELRQLKEDRAMLQKKVENLTLQLQQAQMKGPNALQA